MTRTDRPDNPRAFPSGAIDDKYGGMTLRDWFAGQALAGIMAANVETGGTDPRMPIAVAAYLMADAMLAGREILR